MIGVTLGLAVIATFVLRREEDAIRRERYAELDALAALKVRAIEAWLNERREDAGITAEDPLLSAAPAGPAARAPAQAKLARIAKIYGYRAAWLVDPAARPPRVVASADGRATELPAAVEAVVRRALVATEPVIGDPYRSAEGVRLDFAAALRRADGGASGLVLVLDTAVDDVLEPLVQGWPTVRASAQSVLARRDGDTAVLVTRARHPTSPAVIERLPLTQGIVASRAALGASGALEGPDDRGVEVMAAVHPVAGTDWFLLTQVDRSELIRESRWRVAAVLIASAAGAGAAAALALVVAALQRRNAWHAAYDREHAHRIDLEEYRATLRGIGDAVLSTDAAGRVRRMNAMAEELTGWRETEAQGRPVGEVLHLVDQDSRAEIECPIAQVVRDGGVVHLADRALLIARDGSERPIADSGAAVRDEDGSLIGVVLVFRDQSAERDTQHALRSRAEEAERFNRAAVGRELRMVQLKQEADALRRRLGEPPRYRCDEDERGAPP